MISEMMMIVGGVGFITSLAIFFIIWRKEE